ncbi:MAG: EamA family transporter, partial [Acidobacteriota bacterium]
LGASAVGNTVIMLVSGDARHGVWTWRGAGAIAYLATIGSLVGLVAFTYLLKNVAVSKVATYAFVNPVVAVMLGMVLLHERLNAMELAGTAVVVCAVAMVIYSRMDRGKREIVGETGHALE